MNPLPEGICHIYKCEEKATFSIAKDLPPIRCDVHRMPGNVRPQRKKNQCWHDGCKKTSSFGYKRYKPKFCKTHKWSDMYNVVNMLCHHPGCKKYPIFARRGTRTPTMCRLHGTEGMIDRRSRYCDQKKFECTVVVSGKKYRGLCFSCFAHDFPDEKPSRNYRTKEKEVVDFIRKSFPDATINHDIKVPEGCSRRRPDVMIDFGAFVLIVEIDEDQHQTYDPSCENRRTMELSTDIGHRPLVIVRFNPDAYTKANGERVTSCFGQNKLGHLTIRKSKTAEWQERLNALKETVNGWIERGCEKTVQEVKLFYSA
jgi:hypothetical protein